MKQHEKWIHAPKGKGALAQVACRAVKKRLKAVVRYLDRAGQETYDDIEDVHQLRVSSRRSVSALRVFADLLPRRRSDWMRRQLRVIRRAAGAARDLDVFYQRLSESQAEIHLWSETALRTTIAESRARAQPKLIKLRKKMRSKGFKKKAKQLVARVQWRGSGKSPSLGDAAHDALVPLVSKFSAAAAQDLHDITNLHQMRIDGKRLRYALELFASAFDERLKEDVYPIFVDVQDRLGVVNDHVTAEAMLREWLAKTRDVDTDLYLRSLIETEQQQFVATRDQFHEWWSPERAADLDERFRQLLSENDDEQAVA